ncbi:putative Prostaglandin F synthase [Hypsibius exemplaris]|uniref:Prostaglandin F synthase n=1 Tax=Hypsibius exemplaris TaxID=2072580 RepID=A0A1W0X2A1_HYPEX|nr:putative Prostaglandin F synthase [Hypsibius exemplaris]
MYASIKHVKSSISLVQGVLLALSLIFAFVGARATLDNLSKPQFCEKDAANDAFVVAKMNHTTHTVTTLAGIQMPRLIYGTAWKKEATADLVTKAILTGFRGIDTACQPKHYQEAGVGKALANIHLQHGIPREDIFLQTKFTSINGQDPHTIPYDKNAPLPDQVRQSFAVSLRNLQTTYIDSIVLHGPYPTHAETLTVWRVFEEFFDHGQVKQLGISNTYQLTQLQQLFEDARIKPAVLQNRFHAETGYDSEIRAFCRRHGIIYQSFWTLSANPHLLRSHVMKELAEKRGCTAEQLMFRFVMDLGVAPLTGTTSELHMKQDLAVLDMAPLSAEEIASVEQLMIREYSGHQLNQ